MVNGVTAPEELGEQPKDADPAREPHGQKGELGWHRGGTESLLSPVTPPVTPISSLQMHQLWR